MMTSGLSELPEMIRELKLGLDLGPKLLHLPPAFGVLPPDDLDDGGEDSHPHQDVDCADQHIARLVPAHKILKKVNALSFLWLQF